MDSLIYSLNATIPIFLIIIIGYLLCRFHLISKDFAAAADRLVFRVCLPCMVFLDLADSDIRANFDLTYLSFCFLVTLISILGLWVLARFFCKDKNSVAAFVQGSYRSSAAILGIAFIENIYGSAQMAPLMMLGCVPLYNIFAILIFVLEGSAGDDIPLRHRVKNALIGVITNPIIIGILLGLVFSLLPFSLPTFVDKTIQTLGSATTPLALLSIGATFTGRAVIKKIRPTVIATVIKLVGLTAIFLPIAVWLGFRDEKLLAVLIMLASPCTPTCYIMAKNMGGDAALSSGIIVSTTLFSAVTLTGWIFFLRAMGWI